MPTEIPHWDQLEEKYSSLLMEGRDLKEDLTLIEVARALLIAKCNSTKDLLVKTWEELVLARQAELEDILRNNGKGICKDHKSSRRDENIEEWLGIFPRDRLFMLYQEERGDNKVREELYYLCEEDYALLINSIGGLNIKNLRISLVGRIDGKLICDDDGKDVSGLIVTHGENTEPIYKYFELPELPPRPVI